MAKNNNEDFMNQTPNMLFDLRQTYAMQILTPILLDLEFFRSECNFKKWFETLTERLYTNVYQKLDDPERTEYGALKNKIIKELNTYKNAFVGTSKNEEERYRVKQALFELELWLKAKMEEKGLYGKGSEYDWDEI